MISWYMSKSSKNTQYFASSIDPGIGIKSQVKELKVGNEDSNKERIFASIKKEMK